MIPGLLMAFIAGSLVGLQNIFNSKVNERAVRDLGQQQL
jgi:bacterial/archaeal transporter family-2 protein